MNSPTLQRTLDPSKDGTGQHLFFADDANSYALGYYTGDFVPVAGNSASPLPANGSGAYAAALAQRDLYNGNIPTMLTALRDLSGAPMPLHANVYRYDRLNRIKGMDVYHGAPATDLSALANNDDYRTAYSYAWPERGRRHPNGNILDLERNAHGSNRAMDRFAYHYTPGTNRLEYVDDTQPAANWPDDLDDQIAGNYAYDEKGRLIKDALAGIAPYGIVWTLHDKVRAVTRTDSDLDELHFRYGPMGHRTVKEVRPRTGGNTTQEDQWTTTYYIHDAQGNPMAIYRRSYQPTQGGTYRDQLVADGLPVYGSARLGMNQRPSLYRPEFSTTGFDGLHFAGRSYTQMPSPWVADDHADRTLGHKAYELANHLGNVLTTVTDRRMAVPNAGNPGLLDSYMADVRSVSDYYPFGSLLPGRNSSSDSYRFGFNGMESDREISGERNNYDFGARLYDCRVGRFLAVDRFASKYAYQSPYVFAGNTPIQAIDLGGDSIWVTSRTYTRVRNGITYTTVIRTIHFTGVLLSVSDFDRDMHELADKIEAYLNSQYANKTWNRGKQVIKVVYMFDANIRVAESMNDVGVRDHLLVDVDMLVNQQEGEIGIAYLGGQIAYISRYNADVGFHEFCHNFGLLHVDEDQLPTTNLGDRNIMNPYAEEISPTLNYDQLDFIYNSAKSGRLNRGDNYEISKTGTFPWPHISSDQEPWDYDVNEGDKIPRPVY